MPDHKHFQAYCKQHKVTNDDLKKIGVWLVYGDDQNDYTPLLGTYTGTMRAAINRALELDENPDFLFHYWAKECWGKIILAKRL